jgi:hypothetical protein
MANYLFIEARIAILRLLCVETSHFGFLCLLFNKKYTRHLKNYFTIFKKML